MTFSNTLPCFSIYFSCFSIYFSWENNRNFADIKEMPPSKILQGRCVEPGASFHGKTSFSSRFFFNRPEIFVENKKTDYCNHYSSILHEITFMCSSAKASTVSNHFIFAWSNHTHVLGCVFT